MFQKNNDVKITVIRILAIKWGDIQIQSFLWVGVRLIFIFILNFCSLRLISDQTGSFYFPSKKTFLELFILSKRIVRSQYLVQNRIKIVTILRTLFLERKNEMYSTPGKKAVFVTVEPPSIINTLF